MIETLNILDNYQPKPGASLRTDADYLHYLIEAHRGGVPLRAYYLPQSALFVAAEPALGSGE